MKRYLGIHDGVFHADEVCAAALLLYFNLIDRDKIRRTRDEAALKECEYVCDVGGVYDPKNKRFDHHQSSYKGPLSSCGMVLEFLKEKQLLGEREFTYLNDTLVKGVDDHDNGRSPQLPGVCTFSHVIANYPPIEADATDEQMGRAFDEALDFALGHIRRSLGRLQYARSCEDVVKKAMERGGLCLYFEQQIPWLENFFALGGQRHPALFLIMPSKGHWKLRGIPPDLNHRMQVRLALPKEWAGLLADELREKSGIKGAIFCHKGLFTSVWETKEDAKKALQKVLEINGIQDEKSV